MFTILKEICISEDKLNAYFIPDEKKENSRGIKFKCIFDIYK